MSIPNQKSRFMEIILHYRVWKDVKDRLSGFTL